MALSLCDINWNNNFGSIDCTNQTPGLNRVFGIIPLARIETIEQNDCDPDNPESTGVITEINLVTDKFGVLFSAHKDTVDFVSTRTINDNRNKDVSEELKATGNVSSANLCWTDSFFGVDIVTIIEDNDNELWAIGHDGGLSLEEDSVAFGVNGGKKAIDVVFRNSSGIRFKKIVYDSNVYPDNDAFLSSKIA